MRLRYTQAARQDLKAIYRSSARQFGLAQADAYRDGLLAALGFCAENPTVVREIVDNSRALRAHPYRSHLIIFVIDDETVSIVRVLHSRQDIHRNL